MSKIMEYGPAVLGQEEFDRLHSPFNEAAQVFGVAVTGEMPKQEPAPAAGSYLSFRTLKALLEAQPQRMDHFLAAEWERPGGPRKSALQLFLEMELQKPSPRDVLVARLTEALSLAPNTE